MYSTTKNISRFPLRSTGMMILFSVCLLSACGPKKSAAREWINNPAHGYIQEVKGNGYTLKMQYQTPAYRADQEIILNKSKVKKSELVDEYDQLQQFVISYASQGKEASYDNYGLMDCFRLYTNDTIPCIDVHPVSGGPGSPTNEMIVLFPLTEKELGEKFSLLINNFPSQGDQHTIRYSLTKK